MAGISKMGFSEFERRSARCVIGWTSFGPFSSFFVFFCSTNQLDLRNSVISSLASQFLLTGQEIFKIRTAQGLKPPWTIRAVIL